MLTVKQGCNGMNAAHLELAMARNQNNWRNTLFVKLNRNGADEWLWKQLSINEGEAIQGLAGVEAEGCGGEPVIRGEQPHNHCCCTSAVNVCYVVSYIYPSACSELLCF